MKFTHSLSYRYVTCSKSTKKQKDDQLLESALKLHNIPIRTPPKSRFSNPFFQKTFHQEIQCIQCTLLTLINSRCWSDLHWDDYINKNSPISRENDSADHFVGMKNLIEGRLLVNIPLRMIGQRLVSHIASLQILGMYPRLHMCTN